MLWSLARSAPLAAELVKNVVWRCHKAEPKGSTLDAGNRIHHQFLETLINSSLPYILSHNRTVVYWEDVLLDADIELDTSFSHPGTSSYRHRTMAPTTPRSWFLSRYRTSNADRKKERKIRPLRILCSGRTTD